MRHRNYKWAASAILAIALVSCAAPGADLGKVSHGRVETINGYRVVSLDGTPAQMGTACGELLGDTVRRVVKDMITQGIGRDPDAYKNILAGSKVMEKFQPPDYLEEIRAMAAAAKVSYDDLLLLQYFGDVRRGISGSGASSLCTSFAALPPNTRAGQCLVGRNFDYFDNGVGEYASVLIYYRPAGKIPFVTVTWAGVINGWTLMNEKGIVVSNNTVFEGRNSLEGVSTCFLLRYVVERATNVTEGVELIRKSARSCATNVLVAAGDPPDPAPPKQPLRLRRPDAAIVEFDHENLAVRTSVDGFVGAANGFYDLYQEKRDGPIERWGRAEVARSLILEKAGTLSIEDNIAGADGVPIVGMNLHSVWIDATNLRLRVAMGAIPACRLPYKAFRLTRNGLTADMEQASSAVQLTYPDRRAKMSQMAFPVVLGKVAP